MLELELVGVWIFLMVATVVVVDIYIYIYIMLDFCSVLITLPKILYIYICDGIGKKLVWKERMAQESWSR